MQKFEFLQNSKIIDVKIRKFAVKLGVDLENVKKFAILHRIAAQGQGFLEIEKT